MLFTTLPSNPLINLLEEVITDGMMEESLPAYWKNKQGTVDIGKVIQEVNDDKKFSITVDVSHFHPKDIDVALDEKKLTISAKSHRGTDACSLDRQFSRSWTLPDDVNPSNLKSSLSEHGHLMIEANKTVPPREIPIIIVGKE